MRDGRWLGPEAHENLVPSGQARGSFAVDPMSQGSGDRCCRDRMPSGPDRCQA
jgi:hypothetical protein